MIDKLWVKKAAIRATKTGAQVLGSYLLAATTLGSVNWKVSLSAAGLAMLLSLLTSIGGIPEVELTKKLEKMATYDEEAADSRENIEIKENEVSSAFAELITKEVEKEYRNE